MHGVVDGAQQPTSSAELSVPGKSTVVKLDLGTMETDTHNSHCSMIESCSEDDKSMNCGMYLSGVEVVEKNFMPIITDIVSLATGEEGSLNSSFSDNNSGISASEHDTSNSMEGVIEVDSSETAVHSVETEAVCNSFSENSAGGKSGSHDSILDKVKKLPALNSVISSNVKNIAKVLVVLDDGEQIELSTDVIMKASNLNKDGDDTKEVLTNQDLCTKGVVSIYNVESKTNERVELPVIGCTKKISPNMLNVVPKSDGDISTILVPEKNVGSVVENLRKHGRKFFKKARILVKSNVDNVQKRNRLILPSTCGNLTSTSSSVKVTEARSVVTVDVPKSNSTDPNRLMKCKVISVTPTTTSGQSPGFPKGVQSASGEQILTTGAAAVKSVNSQRIISVPISTDHTSVQACSSSQNLDEVTNVVPCKVDHCYGKTDIPNTLSKQSNKPDTVLSTSATSRLLGIPGVYVYSFDSEGNVFRMFKSNTTSHQQSGSLTSTPLSSTTAISKGVTLVSNELAKSREGNQHVPSTKSGAGKLIATAAENSNIIFKAVNGNKIGFQMSCKESLQNSHKNMKHPQQTSSSNSSNCFQVTVVSENAGKGQGQSNTFEPKCISVLKNPISSVSSKQGVKTSEPKTTIPNINKKNAANVSCSNEAYKLIWDGKNYSIVSKGSLSQVINAKQLFVSSPGAVSSAGKTIMLPPAAKVVNLDPTGKTNIVTNTLPVTSQNSKCIIKPVSTSSSLNTTSKCISSSEFSQPVFSISNARTMMSKVVINSNNATTSQPRILEKQPKPVFKRVVLVKPSDAACGVTRNVNAIEQNSLKFVNHLTEGSNKTCHTNPKGESVNVIQRVVACTHKPKDQLDSGTLGYDIDESLLTPDVLKLLEPEVILNESEKELDIDVSTSIPEKTTKCVMLASSEKIPNDSQTSLSQEETEKSILWADLSDEHFSLDCTKPEEMEETTESPKGTDKILTKHKTLRKPTKRKRVFTMKKRVRKVRKSEVVENAGESGSGELKESDVKKVRFMESPVRLEETGSGERSVRRDFTIRGIPSKRETGSQLNSMCDGNGMKYTGRSPAEKSIGNTSTDHVNESEEDDETSESYSSDTEKEEVKPEIEEFLVPKRLMRLKTHNLRVYKYSQFKYSDQKRELDLNEVQNSEKRKREQYLDDEPLSKRQYALGVKPSVVVMKKLKDFVSRNRRVDLYIYPEFMLSELNDTKHVQLRKDVSFDAAEKEIKQEVIEQSKEAVWKSESDRENTRRTKNIKTGETDQGNNNNNMKELMSTLEKRKEYLRYIREKYKKKND